MPEVLPSVDDALNPVSPPAPRSALFFDGTNWQVARVSATGYLEIDVLTSALPAGAATAAAQALALAQLQLIEDMRDALQSVATDRLIVRGEDQHFSYDKPLEVGVTGNPSADDGYLASTAVPAGVVWIITNVVAQDITTPLTAIRLASRSGAGTINFYAITRAIVAGEYVPWGGFVALETGDTIRAYFEGSLAADTCWVWLTGYVMTKET